MKGKLRVVFTSLVLVAVGFLLGSFWLEWRSPRLEESDRSEVRGTPASYPDGWESRVRVEVLNGMGEPGAARRAAERLRGMGFDVVYFGNADSFGYEETRVLDRSGDAAAARELADSLGVERVRSRTDTALYLDGTVILGADWRRRMAARDTVAAGERGGSPLDRLLDRLRPR